MERLFAAVGLPPQIAGMAVRGSLPVMRDGRQVGYASTSTWSPVLKKYIALAHVQARITSRARADDGSHGGAPAQQAAAGGEAAVLRTRVEEEMSNAYDAIVIGGGHNGLIAASYLARAGKKVVVLERRDVVGGAAVTEEIFPGYRFTEFSYVVSLLRPGDHPRPRAAEARPEDPAAAEHGHADGQRRLPRRLGRPRPDPARAVPAFAEGRRGLGRVFGRVMARAAKAIKPMIGMVPPDPVFAEPARPDGPAQARPVRRRAFPSKSSTASPSW